MDLFYKMACTSNLHPSLSATLQSRVARPLFFLLCWVGKNSGLATRDYTATQKAALVHIDCGSELIKAGGRGAHRCER